MSKQQADKAEFVPPTTTPDAKNDKAAFDAYVAKLRDGRKPFAGFKQKLAYASRPGYYRYWFNDEPGRIAQASDAGYEHVKNPATGEHEKRVVGTRREGGALLAYLMEIPTVIWEDDQRATHRLNDEREAATKRGRVVARNQQDAKEDEGNFYVPGENKVESGVGRRRG